MKALLIVHGFPPAAHSGTFRNAAFARYLPEFGIEPLVICASDTPDILPYRQANRQDTPFPGTRILSQTDWKVVEATRHPLRRFLRRFPLGWTLAVHLERRVTLQHLAPIIRNAVTTERPDILYASAPPPITLLAAAAAAKVAHTPWVGDLRDPWSYYSWARYRHKLDFFIERHLEYRTLSSAAAVIASTPTARQLLLEEIGLRPERVHVIMNGYDEEDFSFLPPFRSEARETFTIIYTGIFSFRDQKSMPHRRRWKKRLGIDYEPLESDPNTRSPRYFLRAMASLLARKPQHRKHLRIRFVGNFDNTAQQLFAEFPYPECLVISPPMTKREAIAACAQADLCLLLQIEMKRNGRDFCTSIPGKLFDYLRTGMRILAPMQPSDATQLITQLQAGIVVPPRDENAIAAAVESELTAWEARGRVPLQRVPENITRFDRRNLTRDLANLFYAVASVP